MHCVAVESIIKNDRSYFRIDAYLSEEELYDRPASTLDEIREVILSGVLPKKKFTLPSAPFRLEVEGSPQTFLIEHAEGWEGGFPGKSIAFFTPDSLPDPSMVIGRRLDIRGP